MLPDILEFLLVCKYFYQIILTERRFKKNKPIILKIIDQTNWYKIVDKQLTATDEDILNIFLRKKCLFNCSFKRVLSIKIDNINYNLMLFSFFFFVIYNFVLEVLVFSTDFNYVKQCLQKIIGLQMV